MNSNKKGVHVSHCHQQCTSSLNLQQPTIQQNDSSFSSDDTEFLGLPTSSTTTSHRLPPPPSASLSQTLPFAANQHHFMPLHLIDFVDRSSKTPSPIIHIHSPSTTPIPSSSRDTTPTTNNRDHVSHSHEWSSSDEDTSFYKDKNSEFLSTIDTEQRLASEYFNSSRGGYLNASV